MWESIKCARLILPVRLVTHPSGHDSEANAPTSVANVGEGTSCISMVAEGERILLFVDDSAGTEGLAERQGRVAAVRTVTPASSD